MPILSQEGTHASFFKVNAVSGIDLRGITTEIKFRPTT